MYYLNTATTTLEKIAGAFLRPKGITVYWNEPHYVTKVVLDQYFGWILIW